MGATAKWRNVAVLIDGDPVPHLWTWQPEGVPDDLPADHVHDGLDLTTDEGATALVSFLADVGAGSCLLDEWTYAAPPHVGGRASGDALPLLGPAKLVKTADELACIRTAQQVNEEAMAEVQARLLRPGIRATDLSAVFLRRVAQLGAHANTLDPIWQVMPDRIDRGPHTVTGDVVYPTVTTDRILGEGEVIWVDTGITWEGYDFYFGRTWVVVGRDPSTPERDRFTRWRERARPGARRGEARGHGRRPHRGGPPGGGAHAMAAAPLSEPRHRRRPGRGPADRHRPGPRVRRGHGPPSPAWCSCSSRSSGRTARAGWRGEEIVAVTDTGWEPLSSFTYEGWT